MWCDVPNHQPRFRSIRMLLGLPQEGDFDIPEPPKHQRANDNKEQRPPIITLGSAIAH
jgi:hypothetical protein